MLACWWDMDRPTITRAIGEVRPLFAERGRTINPDVRLQAVTEVIDHLGTSGQTGVADGTEIRVRGRPSDVRAGTPSSPGRASRTPSKPWSSPIRTGGRCSAVRPDQASARTLLMPADRVSRPGRGHRAGRRGP
ncbi:hypothetical protein ACFUAB_02315 [Streptomyces cinereoruber]|uniref:hypothetical protein n=1 Tax=Streptomyces cinereoruber TaxID=67260 RepID=UPI003632BD15